MPAAWLWCGCELPELLDDEELVNDDSEDVEDDDRWEEDENADDTGVEEDTGVEDDEDVAADDENVEGDDVDDDESEPADDDEAEVMSDEEDTSGSDEEPSALQWVTSATVMKNRMVSGKRRCLCIVKKDRSGNCSENPKQKSIFFLAFGCFGVLGFSDVMLNNQHTMDCEQTRECFCWG